VSAAANQPLTPKQGSETPVWLCSLGRELRSTVPKVLYRRGELRFGGGDRSGDGEHHFAEVLSLEQELVCVSGFFHREHITDDRPQMPIGDPS
jgi:hypothetical protein